MAILKIPEEDREITDFNSVRTYLRGIGIDYERWVPSAVLSGNPTNSEILEAFASDIERLKEKGGYTTADVIDLNENTPDLDAMLAKFNKEHWHDEDEVRYTISGRGVFHVNPGHSPVVSIEVQEGDLIRVPRGTNHWFDLCGERKIRAIRLFQNKTGWTPYYTESGVAQNFQPVCMGPAYFRPQGAGKR